MAIFDALNRANGKYEFSKDAGLQNLVVRIDPKTGAKIVNPAIATPAAGSTDYICPSDHGARNWLATSFDPTTDILYVPLLEACMNYRFVPRDPAQVAPAESIFAVGRAPARQRRQVRPHRGDQSQNAADRVDHASARAHRKLHAGNGRWRGVQRLA